jgi:tryptophan-rich sensory protein
MAAKSVSMSTRPLQGLALVISIAVPFIIGGLGALSTDGNVEGWYADANVAPWTPPNWVFGPVWSVLYVLIGVSFWRAWRMPSSPTRTAGIRLFIWQLALNAIWTPIFFAGYPLIGPIAFWLGVIIILVMDVLVWMTIVKFKDVDIWSARLLIPYEAWLFIASTLNIYLAFAN